MLAPAVSRRARVAAFLACLAALAVIVASWSMLFFVWGAPR
jgi:hypothetical protein